MGDLTLSQLKELNIERAAEAAKTCAAANGFMTLVAGVTQDGRPFAFGFRGQQKEELIAELQDIIKGVQEGRLQFGDTLET